MKRFFCIFLLISIPYLMINGQKIKYGLTIGFDVANSHVTNRLKGDDSRVFYPMLAYNINGFIGYKSQSFWGLSIEPGFIQKGGFRKNVISYSSGVMYQGDISYRLNYIQFPILANLFINNKLYFSIGPELSYMLSAKAKFDSFSTDITSSYDNKFELSGTIGVNYSIWKNIDIGIRYNHGLTYVSKIQWTDLYWNYIGESKVYNQYFQFIMGIKI
jgi:hypothetical protein